jgi:hypothetical protein
MGPRADLDVVVEWKMFPLPEIEHSHPTAVFLKNVISVASANISLVPSPRFYFIHWYRLS